VARTSKKTPLEQIFENLNFLADVFGEKDEKDIPNVPFLELARCFELSVPRDSHLSHRSKRWSRW
jgi:hypothetical protein